MGKCVHCGQSAGWFSSRHSACEQAHATALHRLPEALADAISAGRAVDDVEPELARIAETGHLKSEAVEALVSEGVARAVDLALDDEELTEAEEDRISEYIHRLAAQHPGLTSAEGVARLVRASVIRNLRAGKPIH